MFLYELLVNGVGYSLFQITEIGEIDSFLQQCRTTPQVVTNDVVVDLSRLKEIVKLVAFVPFGSTLDAFNAISSVSEGLITDELEAFLKKNFPVGEENVLGGIDNDLAANINKYLGIKCNDVGFVPDVIRGIGGGHFFDSVVRGLNGPDGNAESTTRVGPRHSYSHAEKKLVSNLYHMLDNNIKHNADLVDMIEKNINIFSSSLRMWYPYICPELDEILQDNCLHAGVIQLLAEDPQGLPEEKWGKLEEIVKDFGKVESISTAAQCAIDTHLDWIHNILPKYRETIFNFTNRIIRLTSFHHLITKCLIDEMKIVAPNLSELLVGDELLGAKLISHAGSLINLAKCASSQVQIMGVEGIVARCKRRGFKTPQYGMLSSSSFINRAHGRNKGKICRFLANKISVAARLDCFSEPTNNNHTSGKTLHKEVEDRLLFLEASGHDLPLKKNLDFFMDEPTDELEEGKNSDFSMEDPTDELEEDKCIDDSSIEEESSPKKKLKKSEE